MKSLLYTYAYADPLYTWILFEVPEGGEVDRGTINIGSYTPIQAQCLRAEDEIIYQLFYRSPTGKTVMALDTSNNSVLWSTDVTVASAADTHMGGLAVSANYVFASACLGYIYVFSRETGAFITAVELPEIPGKPGAVQWPVYLAVDTFVSPEQLYATVAACYGDVLVPTMYIVRYNIGNDGDLSFEDFWYEQPATILFYAIPLDFNSDFLCKTHYVNPFRLHPRPVTQSNFTAFSGTGFGGNCLRLDDSYVYYTHYLTPTKLWYARLSDGVYMGYDSHCTISGLWSWTLGGESPNGGEPPNGETTAKRAMWQPSPCGSFGHPMHPLGV